MSVYRKLGQIKLSAEEAQAMLTARYAEAMREHGILSDNDVLPVGGTTSMRIEKNGEISILHEPATWSTTQ